MVLRLSAAGPKGSRAAKASAMSWFASAMERAMPFWGPKTAGQVALVTAASLPAVLPELSGLLGDVEDVVDDLEGETGVLAEGAQAVDGVVGGAGDVAARNDRDGDEGAGLGSVDLLDELGSGGAGPQIRGRRPGRRSCRAPGLEGNRSRPQGGAGTDAGPDGTGDLLEDVDGGDGGAVQAGDGVKGEGLESVTGEDGDGVAEDLVAGRLAAAEVVVVERWEVVVNERVGVEHFDGCAELDGSLLCRDCSGADLAGELPGLEAQHGTKPLAAGKDAVPHGAMDGVRRGIGRGARGDRGQGRCARRPR